MKSLRKTIIKVGLLFILASCARDHFTYQVKGASTAFCIPKELNIQTPYWVPDNSRGTSEGFAFRGCRYAEKSKSSCIIPDELNLSGAVSSKDKFKGWSWEDFDEDAFYRKVVSSAGVNLEIHDYGSVVLVQNIALWGDWYVWKKAIPLSASEKPFLTNGDRLVAVCNDQGFVFCNRLSIASDFSIGYHFYSSERVPKDLDKLDALVFKQIDRWRCHKSGVAE